MPTASNASLSGTFDPRFAPVSDALQELVSSGEELGASLTVDVDGRTVVDVWGGWQDPKRRVPWTEDTIVNVWSSTKTVTNLAALVLVDRGLLDPYARGPTTGPSSPPPARTPSRCATSSATPPACRAGKRRSIHGGRAYVEPILRAALGGLRQASTS